MVKTLRPHLEAQSLHGFVDERSAGEGLDIEVANRIVALRVVDIEQRGHFGECSVQMLQERLCLRLVVRAAHAELHEEHDFARGGGAEHHVAQQARLLAEVEKRQAVRKGVCSNAVAQAVVYIVHQMTFFDVENFIECAGNMKAHGVHAIELHARGHLLRGEPLFVGKTEFELVAIAGNVLAAKYGHHFGQFYLADARKVVPNLLLLETELLFVGQALPFATAAHAEVLAEGLGTEFGRLF